MAKGHGGGFTTHFIRFGEHRYQYFEAKLRLGEHERGSRFDHDGRVIVTRAQLEREQCHRVRIGIMPNGLSHGGANLCVGIGHQFTRIESHLRMHHAQKRH